MIISMALKAFKRRRHSAMFTDQKHVRESRFSATTSRLSTMTSTKLFVVFLIALPLLVALKLSLPRPTSSGNVGFADVRNLEKGSNNGTSVGKSSEDEYKDKLLGGLLAPGFDEGSCLSRYQASLYRKPSPYKPSSYLLSRLRNYEDLHKRCGPHSEPYKRTVNELMVGNKNITSSRETECKYVVYTFHSKRGLGNRIQAATSAFLYAILTNRVLLIDQGKDMSDLFCEPFPESSWFLPENFPLKNNLDLFNQTSHDSFGNMLKNNMSKSNPSAYLYVYLEVDYDFYDKLFFCDENQPFLSRVPWLILKTSQYFVPSLFLMQCFEQELGRLFPNKTTVFHHLGRYLFHPTNEVWGLITRYYEAYLANADERIGIQIRVFEGSFVPPKDVTDQILSCTMNQKLLPQVNEQNFVVPPPSGKPRLKAVLVTSLGKGYYEILRNMYWENPTVTGDFVGVYQPSHDKFQQTEKQSHNRKALAEIYLLSLTDVLVTSARSTFGYVAQGLGGLRPWILYRPDGENLTVPGPPCVQLMSTEPCLHAPTYYDCKAKTGVDVGNVVPYVRHCEDTRWGIKVVDSHDKI